MSATGINMEYGWYMILVQPQVIIYPIGRRNCLVIVTVGDKGAGSFFGYLFFIGKFGFQLSKAVWRIS